MPDGMTYATDFKGKQIPSAIKRKVLFIANYIEKTTQHQKINVTWGSGAIGSNTRAHKTPAEKQAQAARRQANLMARQSGGK